jgi:carnitine O-acetyltransferase
LLGLKLIAAENGRPIPALFQTDAYKRLMHFLLSTSQVPTKNVLPMGLCPFKIKIFKKLIPGFGPSDPDCYGICYNPQESRIFFTITAYNECRETSAKR